MYIAIYKIDKRNVENLKKTANILEKLTKGWKNEPNTTNNFSCCNNRLHLNLQHCHFKEKQRRQRTWINRHTAKKKKRLDTKYCRKCQSLYAI